jgi:hypothetical protein
LNGSESKITEERDNQQQEASLVQLPAGQDSFLASTASRSAVGRGESFSRGKLAGARILPRPLNNRVIYTGIFTAAPPHVYKA